MPVLRVLSLLPLPVLYALFGLLMPLVRLFGWRHGLLAANLERCFPERSASERRMIERDFYAYLGELTAEVMHAGRISADELADRVRLANPEVVQDLLDTNKRVLILAAHHCNWEWLLLRASSYFSEPLVAAYKPASREAPDRLLLAMRRRFGATLVPAKQIVQHLLEQRGKVRLLALNADQSPATGNDQQSWLPFFGQETSFYRGPGWISTKMGYHVFLAAMRRERRGHYTVEFLPLAAAGKGAEPETVLLAYSQVLEQHVRHYPVEYFWAYKRWKRGKRLYD